ncbi:hypothetical protein CAP51_08725 [Acinetobacter populi]|uniref:Roadblock/LAMTOR2 domain-containing protein n=2 Tax=Acinetobacter populi TaxID=1582270 RepID=A0A1Z9Z0A8_9GAMM|nr:hypothetical protein CAP51_08725 [Acinetobacter populi]
MLDDALQRAMSGIPDCLAAGFVDLNSGMILSIKTVDSHPSDVFDFLAAATADLFQGPNVVSIENIFKKARGLPEEEEHHYFQEIIVNSENLIHVFIRTKKQQQVVCFVCRKGANLGMVLTKARIGLPAIEQAFYL